MRGDFTRDTFDPAKHFGRVLMQQGRVTLDADFNEQSAISLRYLRTLARDIIGPYAAPAGKDANGNDLGGFKLTKLDQDPNKGLFSISNGCYYVDGILVENDADDCTYKNQPDYDPPASDLLLNAQEEDVDEFFIYLDVWEQHITQIEDGSFREKALGGPDTCTRAKVVWQVRALPLTEELKQNKADAEEEISGQLDDLWKQKAELEKQFAAETDETKQVTLLKKLQLLDEELARLTQLSLLRPHQALLSGLIRLSNAKLAARVDPGRKTEDACVTPPASKYRGAENQLYRVEIHQGGKVGDSTPPTFKWSRDNGSVATAWVDEGSDLQVASARGFAAGNWVELSDDTLELLGQPGTLVQLVKVEGDTISVDPDTTLPARSADSKHPKVRRWDQIRSDAVTLVDGAMLVQEPAAGKDAWIDLEDGVQIQFSADGEYRTGDYWLIPARVATGNVEWPLETEADGTPKKDTAGNFIPLERSPHGIEHHYALLGFASWSSLELKIENARFEFWPMFFGIADPEVGRGVRVGPDRAAPAAPKKPRKARKRQTKKGPAAPPEGAPS